MYTTEELLALREKLVAQGATYTREAIEADAAMFDEMRAKVRAESEEAHNAVDAARAELTQPPSDVASKTLAESMFARLWPSVQESISDTRDIDGGISEAYSAIMRADNAVRPLLTQSIVEVLRKNGLRDYTIDANLLIPLSPKLSEAFTARDVAMRHEIRGLHNIDQLQYNIDMPQFVAPTEQE